MARDLSFSARGGLGRLAGGAAALTFPTFLVAIALRVDFRAVGDQGDLATAFLGTILLVIAVPTAWIFAIDFIEAGRFTIVLVSVLTSYPIWYLVGSRLASRSSSWGQWTMRYTRLCLTWCVVTILVLELVGSM